MGSILAFDEAGGPAGGRLGGGGGHSHTGVRGGYPQGFSHLERYPQGFYRRLIGRERSRIVGV